MCARFGPRRGSRRSPWSGKKRRPTSRKNIKVGHKRWRAARRPHISQRCPPSRSSSALERRSSLGGDRVFRSLADAARHRRVQAVAHRGGQHVCVRTRWFDEIVPRFVIGLTSHIKHLEVTGLFTNTTPMLMGGETITETHISTITDTNRDSPTASLSP